MIDSSSYEFEENVRRTQQIASLAHGMGLSCEAELGHVGQEQADDSNVDLYTNVKQAKEFVERTNCDCLAVAIGTAHGAYPKGMIPKLDFERLRNLKQNLICHLYFMEVVVLAKRISEKLSHVESTRLMCVQI